jgi:hypothetical protein
VGTRHIEVARRVCRNADRAIIAIPIINKTATTPALRATPP